VRTTYSRHLLFAWGRGQKPPNWGEIVSQLQHGEHRPSSADEKKSFCAGDGGPVSRNGIRRGERDRLERHEAELGVHAGQRDDLHVAQRRNR
jgi:hypothetical protein